MTKRHGGFGEWADQPYVVDHERAADFIRLALEGAEKVPTRTFRLTEEAVAPAFDVDPEGPAPVVNVKGAQRLLGGVSRQFVYNLMGDGDLVRVKVGNRTMVSVPSIAAYLARRQGHDSD